MDSIELNNRCCRSLGYTKHPSYDYWIPTPGTPFNIINQLKDRALFDCDMGFAFLMARASGCMDLEGSAFEVSERCLKEME